MDLSMLNNDEFNNYPITIGGERYLYSKPILLAHSGLFRKCDSYTFEKWFLVPDSIIKLGLMSLSNITDLNFLKEAPPETIINIYYFYAFIDAPICMKAISYKTIPSIGRILVEFTCQNERKYLEKQRKLIVYLMKIDKKIKSAVIGFIFPLVHAAPNLMIENTLEIIDAFEVKGEFCDFIAKCAIEFQFQPEKLQKYNLPRFEQFVISPDGIIKDKKISDKVVEIDDIDRSFLNQFKR